MLWAHRDANQKRPVSASVTVWQQCWWRSAKIFTASEIPVPAARYRNRAHSFTTDQYPAESGCGTFRPETKLNSKADVRRPLSFLGLHLGGLEAWPRASSPALPLASCPRSATRERRPFKLGPKSAIQPISFSSVPMGRPGVTRTRNGHWTRQAHELGFRRPSPSTSCAIPTVRISP